MRPRKVRRAAAWKQVIATCHFCARYTATALHPRVHDACAPNYPLAICLVCLVEATGAFDELKDWHKDWHSLELIAIERAIIFGDGRERPAPTKTKSKAKRR